MDATDFKVTNNQENTGMAVVMAQEFKLAEDSKRDKEMLAKIFSKNKKVLQEEDTAFLLSWGGPENVGASKARGADKPGKRYVRWKSKEKGDDDEKKHRVEQMAQNSGIPSPLYPAIKHRIKMIACSQDRTVVLTANGMLRYMPISGPSKSSGAGGRTKWLEEDISLTSRRVKYIAAGNKHFGAISEENNLNLYMWGENDKYQLGQGDNTEPIRKPEQGQVRALQGLRIVHVSCGGAFTFAVTSMNIVYAWGDNSYQQLGLGTRDKIGNFIPKLTNPVKSPIKVEEFNRFGAAGTDVVKIGDMQQDQFVQLMLSAGDKHAISWANVEEMNQFSEDFWERYEYLKNRLQNLQFQIKSRDAQIEHLKTSNSGVNTVQGVTQADDLVDRRVTDDETLNMTGEMLTSLQQELGRVVRERLDLANQIEHQEKLRHGVEQEVSLIEKNIQILWDAADKLSFEYQMLEDQRNKTQEQVQKIESKKLEMQGKQNLASAAENTLVEESMKLQIFENQLEKLQEEDAEFAIQQSGLEKKTKLINRLYIQRDKQLRRLYLAHHQEDIFDMIGLVKVIWGQIKATSVTAFTANMSEMERLTAMIGRRPGLADIVNESDALLEQHIVRADMELSKLIDSTDARKDLADLLREILHDIVTMRLEINAYLQGILEQTNQRLEQTYIELQGRKSTDEDL